ncbi:MAG TPA: C-GCAxxG-C-C family protein [Candidatus Agathobaculum pullistercoris]|nr:C-GCAxxG-C-C family protein [uncultured Agathobaculum sp.]HIX11493.1 C-GCAxxG-C-C family protein [Candidatus Agathobaculum pullistercoris]
MTERAERAQSLHNKGYNCAQAVVCAYCDLFGLDEETAYKMAEGFGLGMGMMDTCGALSAAFMLAGMQGSKGTEHPGETKAQTYKTTKMLAAAFREKNGTYLCRELKGIADGKMRRSCPGCIEDACSLIETALIK